MLSTFALTSTFVALAASAPLAKRFVQAPEYVFGDSYLSNATFGNFIAKEYAIKENSCGLTNFDTDYVVSVKTNHTKLDEVCNMQVNVTNKDNGKWVLATIVDECVTCSYNYLLLSPAAYEKVSSDSNFTATYTFSNYQTPDTSSTSGQGQAPAPQKQSSSSSSSAKQQTSSTSSTSAAPAKQSDNSNDDSDYKPSASSSSSSSKQYQPAQDDQSSTSTSQKTTTTKQEQDDKPEYTSTSTSSSKYYAPTTTSTSWTPEATTSSTKWVQTTKAQPTTSSTKQEQTYAPEPTTTQQQQQQQQQQPQSNNSGGGGGQFSGRATYFYQGGNPGSCGNYNSDSAYIVAVNDAQMNGGLCGRSVRITNTANGQSITASVADTCPGCGYGSLDLSVAAFQGLGSMDSGVLPISWSFA